MRILTWIFLILSLATAATFTTFYGVSFGNAACQKWLSSMFLSFFTSLLLVQPLKSSARTTVEVMSNFKPRRLVILPPDPEALEKIRVYRMKQRRANDIIREIIFYIIFLSLLFTVTLEFRDPFGYPLRQNIENSFFGHAFTKVVLLVMFLSLLCKRADRVDEIDILEEEDALIDELGKRYQLQVDEEFLHNEYCKNSLLH
ncbi:hypothetical protein AHF37_09155 [Paragonimus kellicotti]|nr:hypothetical protein AHF37_09155 [Paragonimus kellicotti]